MKERSKTRNEHPVYHKISFIWKSSKSKLIYKDKNRLMVGGGVGLGQIGRIIKKHKEIWGRQGRTGV
jgi:hypothetical protein